MIAPRPSRRCLAAYLSPGQSGHPCCLSGTCAAGPAPSSGRRPCRRGCAPRRSACEPCLACFHACGQSFSLSRHAPSSYSSPSKLFRTARLGSVATLAGNLTLPLRRHGGKAARGARLLVRHGVSYVTAWCAAQCNGRQQPRASRRESIEFVKCAFERALRRAARSFCSRLPAYCSVGGDAYVGDAGWAVPPRLATVCRPRWAVTVTSRSCPVRSSGRTSRLR